MPSEEKDNLEFLGIWMTLSQEIMEVSEGLEKLAELDHLLIYSTTPTKAMRAFPVAANKHFIIKNEKEEIVYIANKYTGQRTLCGNRGFKLEILNKNEENVFSVKSRANLGSCCGSCVPWIEVLSKKDTLIGCIEQKCSPVQEKYMLRDKGGYSQLRIRGPPVPLWCVKQPELKVYDKVGPLKRGLIVKVGDEKNCELEILFSNSLDTSMKAVILAMSFVFVSMPVLILLLKVEHEYQNAVPILPKEKQGNFAL